MARTWDDTGMASYNGPRHPEPPGDTSLPLFLRPSTAPTLDREELEALPEARAEAAQAARAKRGIVDYSQRGVDMGPSIYELRERRTVLRSPGGGAQLGGIADSQPYPGSKIGWNSELDVEWEYSPEASSKLMAAATEAVTKADKSIGDLAAALGDRDVAVIKAWEKAGIIPGAKRSIGGHRRYTSAQVDGLRSIASRLGILRARRLSPQMAADLKSASHPLWEAQP